jgi:hypothetical protein
MEIIVPITFFSEWSNHLAVKMFPFVQYFAVEKGLTVKLLEIKSLPNEKSITISQYLESLLDEHDLKSKCVALIQDNCNTNFGGQNRGDGKSFSFSRPSMKTIKLVAQPIFQLSSRLCVRHHKWMVNWIIF